MRLFLAIDIPDAIQQQVEQLYLPEIRECRWTPLEQLHITLVFIGEQPSSRLDDIIRAVSKINFRPFTVKLNQIGHFRSGIIWLGVENSEDLQRTQKKLKAHLSDMGIAISQRKFTPHITLCRSKNISPEVLSRMSRQALGVKYQFCADTFQLKSSILKPSGAVYETEAEFYPGPNKNL